MSESGINSTKGQHVVMSTNSVDCLSSAELQTQQSSYDKLPWDRQIEGLNRLSATSASSRALFNSNLKSVIQQYLGSITSLRSQVSGGALQALNVFQQNMGGMIDNEQQSLLSVLQTKLGETSKSFLVEETAVAQDTQARVSPAKRLVPLQWQSRDCKSAARQSGLAWFIYKLILHQGNALLGHLPRPQNMGSYNEVIVNRQQHQQNRSKAAASASSQHALLVKIQHVQSALAEDRAADARQWTAKSFLLQHVLLDPANAAKNVVPYGGTAGSPFEVLLASATQDMLFNSQIDVGLVALGSHTTSPQMATSSLSSPRPSVSRVRALSSPVMPRPSLVANGVGSLNGTISSQVHGSSGVLPSCNVHAVLRLLTSRDWSDDMQLVRNDVFDSDNDAEDEENILPEGYMLRYRFSLQNTPRSMIGLSQASSSGVISSRNFRPSPSLSPRSSVNTSQHMNVPAELSSELSRRESPRHTRTVSQADMDRPSIALPHSTLSVYGESSDSQTSTPSLTPRAYQLHEKSQLGTASAAARTAPTNDELHITPRLRPVLATPQAPVRFTALNNLDSLDKSPIQPHEPPEPQERKAISSKLRLQRTRVPTNPSVEEGADVK